MNKASIYSTADDDSSSSSSSNSSGDDSASSSGSDEEEFSKSSGPAATTKAGLNPKTITPPDSPPLNRGSVTKLGSKVPLAKSLNKSGKPDLETKGKGQLLNNPFLKNQTVATPMQGGIGMLAPDNPEGDDDSSEEDGILGSSLGPPASLKPKVAAKEAPLPKQAAPPSRASSKSSSKVADPPLTAAKGTIDDKKDKSKKSSKEPKDKKKESKDKKEKKEKEEKDKRKNQSKKDGIDGTKKTKDTEKEGSKALVEAKGVATPELNGNSNDGTEEDNHNSGEPTNLNAEKDRGFMSRLFTKQKAVPHVAATASADSPEEAGPIIDKKKSGRFPLFQKKNQTPDSTEDDIEIEFVSNNVDGDTAENDKIGLFGSELQMVSATSDDIDLENPAPSGNAEQGHGAIRPKAKQPGEHFPWCRLLIALLIIAILIVGSTVGTAFWGTRIYMDKHGDSGPDTDSAPGLNLESNECDYDDNLLLEFRILFDSKPEQTGFSLRDAPPFSSGIWVMEAGTFRSFSQFQKKNTLRICLSEKLNYTFEIEDTFGDGMVSEFGETSVYGQWELTFNDQLIASYNGNCFANSTDNDESLGQTTNATRSFCGKYCTCSFNLGVNGTEGGCIEECPLATTSRPVAPAETDPPSAGNETTGPAASSTIAPTAAVVTSSLAPAPAPAVATSTTIAPTVAVATTTILPTAAVTSATSDSGATEPPLILLGGRRRAKW